MSDPTMPQDPFEPQLEPTGPRRSTSVLEREEVREQLQEPGDHERFAHYVDKNKMMESALSGEPVIALCGKVWVPTRDGTKFPVCPTCRELLDTHWPGGGGKDPQ